MDTEMQQVATFNPSIPPPNMSNQASTQTSNEPPRIENIWRLCKSKNLLLYHLCTECLRKLNDSTDKISQASDGSVTIKIGMCDKCARGNCIATYYLAPPNPKPPQGAVNNQAQTIQQ